MRKHFFLLLGWVLAAALTGAVQAAAPALAEGGKDGPLVLLAATVRVGGQDPRDPGCSKPGVVCMNPPPYWLEADVMSTLYGPPAPAHVQIRGSDHYGIEPFKTPGTAYLVLARAVGQHYDMLRYRRHPLVRNKDGEAFLIRQDAKPPTWLPCAIDEAQEELMEADFDDASLFIAPENMDYAGVNAHPERFLITSRGPMPRYGIRLKNLAAAIDKATRAGTPLTCTPVN